MKLAIVGSVSLADDERAWDIIEAMIRKYQPTLIISGGAQGIDSMAVSEAKRRGIPYVEHLPKTQNWAGFKPRNLLIAQDCDALVRIVASNSKTYGSGWTRDRAKEMGKPTEEFVVEASL